MYSYLLLASLFFLFAPCLAKPICNLKPSQQPYKLSVCTMVHNEAWYIEEWVAYHRTIGVDHFYIYDDESVDIIAEVLAPYIKLGIVTLIPWNHEMRTVDVNLVSYQPPYTRKQRFAIADCMFNHKTESEWFGVWDMDEFAVLNGSFADMGEFLGYVGEKADDWEIPSTSFGCTGQNSTPAGLVIENFRVRSKLTVFGMNPDDNKFSGKSIYRSGCGMPNVHWSSDLNLAKSLVPSLSTEPECKKTKTGWIIADGDRSHLPLTINHYAIKSWSHFKEKSKKWHFGLNRTTFDLQVSVTQSFNDYSMIEFMKPVKDLMECMHSHSQKT